MVLGMTGMTYARNKVWNDEVTLWEDVVRKSPNNARGYYNYGLVYKNKGDINKAKKYFEMAIKNRFNYPIAHNNLGNCYFIQKEFISAIAEYKKAIELNNKMYKAYYNLAVSLEKIGRKSEAVYYYLIFLRKAPASYNHTKKIIQKKYNM